MAKRNGKLEIMRFFFCMSVFIYHIGNDLVINHSVFPSGFSFFSHGRSGVEFFFIVSGYFCAKAAKKHLDSKSSIGIDTYDYVKNKIVRILPQHIICCIGMLVVFFIYRKSNVSFKEDFIDYIPNFFLMQRTGVYMKDLISVEWYICSMLLALAIIYPLLRKHFNIMAYVVAPVSSVLMIGYMIQKYGYLPKTNQFDGFTYSCNIRAVAVILLGVFCFVVSEKIREMEKTKAMKVFLVVAENACWIASVYFIVSDMKMVYEGIYVYVVAAAITLCLSRDFKTKLYQNDFTAYLGKVSLPIYLCQNIIRQVFSHEFTTLSLKSSVVLMTASVIVLGVAIQAITDLYYNLKKRNKKTIDKR